MQQDDISPTAKTPVQIDVVGRAAHRVTERGQNAVGRGVDFRAGQSV